MDIESSLKTAKILTQNKLSDRFLETKIYEPADPAESIYGNTYLLVEVTTPWFPTAKITKLIRNTFLEEYYHLSPNRQEFKRFEDGLKAVNKKLSDLAGAGQTEWIGNLNAIIATISAKKLFLSHTGTVEAYLFRQNKISHITENEDSPKNAAPIQTFSALINGDLQLEDKLVFSNAEMYNFVSIDTLRNAISQISPSGAIDEISHILFREKANKVNAIFVYLADENKIDAKLQTSMPDTIFLDAPEEGSIWKHGFSPKNIATKTKRGITSFGFALLGAYSFAASRLKRGSKEEQRKTEKRILKSEPKDLSYMTSSIDLNLSQNRSRGRDKKNLLANIFSYLTLIYFRLKNLNRKWLYGLIALLIILSVFVGIYYKVKTQSKSSSDLTTVLASAQEKINSADTQAALHNETEAKKLLSEAQAMLLEIKDKPKSPVEVVILLEKIQEKLNKLNKIVLIDNPKELANLSSLATGVEARNLVYLGGALYSLNTNGQELLVAIADKGDKQIQTKIPDNAGKAQNLAVFENEKIIVIESAKGMVFEFNLKTNKLEEKKNEKDLPYPTAETISTYLTTLYFLNKDEGQMIKYAPSGSGYDKGRDVYKIGAVNLKDVNSFAVDGNIYLLHEDGIIDKTLKGTLDANFKVKNIPEPNSQLTEPNQMVTNSDSSSLYVLENKNRRVVELNKNGDYLRQFVFKENLGEINNIAVNEKAKKLYLLANNKIFEIDL
ncbi:MAG: Uncharacterized protein CEN92_327, partial [Candidatus Berkelbacteria bacterium Licking1014_96]